LEKKLKIALFVTNDLVTDQRMHRICATLQNTDKWDILLVGREHNNSLPLESFSFKTKRLGMVFKTGKLFYLAVCVRYFLFGLFNKFDLICSVDADTVLPCHFISQLKGAIHIHDAHELFTQVPELEGREKAQKIWKKIEEIGFTSVQAFYTVSNGLADYYNQYTANGILKCPVQVIRNLPYHKPLDRSITKQFDVIYQGAINKGRGILELMEASEIGNFSVLIVGIGDLENQLKARVPHCKNVTYLGAVKPAELHHLTQQAKIGFNALDISSKSYDEALPNKTFDYMMAGIPQLISNSNALVHLNKEIEIAIVCQLNAKDIAEKIRRLLDEELLYKRLQTNAINGSTIYCWENEAEKLKAIYQKFEI